MVYHGVVGRDVTHCYFPADCDFLADRDLRLKNRYLAEGSFLSYINIKNCCRSYVYSNFFEIKKLFSQSAYMSKWIPENAQ